MLTFALRLVVVNFSQCRDHLVIVGGMQHPFMTHDSILEVIWDTADQPFSSASSQ